MKLTLPLVNAHIHLPPNFSAFESVSQAVTLAAAQKVAVLGASNYYDFRVYADFAVQAQAQGIFPHWRERCLTQGVFAQMDAVGHQSATHVLTASYCGHQSGLGILH